MNKKTVFVTGASRGIGKAIALHYAKKGYHVAICCHKNTALLSEVKKQIENWGCNCFAYIGDMGSSQEAKMFIDQAIHALGTPDVLINNAGISYIGLLQDMSEQQWLESIQANLSSVFHCSKEIIPAMLQKKAGKIINISSVWGNVGASTEVAYSTTKGGINAFTRALAKELGPSNIQVNAVACGMIDTDMNKGFSAEEVDAITEEIPAGRMGTPEEVAHLVYQISQKNDYLTGQVITLDGGWI